MNINEGRFAGKVAIVTGSGSGIGAAVTRRLIAEGASVVGADLNPGDGSEYYVPVVTNVTVEADLEAAVATAVSSFGGLDLAFNIAGAAKGAPIVDHSESDWDFTVDLVLKGIFLSTKHEARAMKSGGAIVNVSSLNAHVPMFGGSAYASAKAGVEMFSKNAALELGRSGIRVNAILPGLVSTPLTSAFSENEALAADFNSKIVLGRPADPDELAGPILYLASEDAGYITGTSLVVDGGWEITGYPDLSKY
ncbi:NAD(P)-dependent dehydrogenase (short-subunit alcohol dehydrogenase family) [Cryobacterium mesophilum]|uniref:SDR family oxidoreductase n=1 Tax=Terrimesophilobacter mesophilus TaxID=433647 RepID=A0A4R8VAK5_9MICO|nr:SDR family NAD(P)-dependent oxidoreductase [Terrimesophilobacter mesophilus]MBB5633528.1 NAD(P)-dependent dehydrogenase (short-subunit alcohol dehydrogenase family) [Terrimesophilobacter mesophilus]TFB80234.1 SDR family oxidoreductase [Terrimesophilobacter mesophilus]